MGIRNAGAGLWAKKKNYDRHKEFVPVPQGHHRYVILHVSAVILGLALEFLMTHHHENKLLTIQNQNAAESASDQVVRLSGCNIEETISAGFFGHEMIKEAFHADH